MAIHAHFQIDDDSNHKGASWRMTLVKDFYTDAQKEWEGLDLPIEFASTITLVDSRFLKAGWVAGIGAGPGRTCSNY